MHSFFFRALQLISFSFHSRFLHKLKHMVHLSKTVCGIFDIQFRFVFIKVACVITIIYFFFGLTFLWFDNIEI